MLSPVVSYNSIVSSLVNGQLHDALASLKSQVADLQDWPLMDELVSIEEAYTLMLKYFADGVADDGRMQVYRNLMMRTMAVADMCKREAGIKDATSVYYAKVRTYNRVSRTLSDYIEPLMHDDGISIFDEILGTASYDPKRAERINELFDAIWVQPQLDEQGRVALSQMFESETFRADEKAWMVSALTLSALYYYDDAKVQQLVWLFASEDEMVRCRAIIGVALVAMHHKERLKVAAPYEMFDLLDDMSTTWAMVQILLFNTYNTKRIRKQMENDVLPLFMNVQSRVEPGKLQDILEDEDGELPPGMDNGMIERLHDKLHKVSENQLMGLDMYFANFCRVKSFPFFAEVRNWVRPFGCDDDVAAGDKTIMSFVQADRNVCPSDKYSLLFALKQMPDDMHKFIEQQMEGMQVDANSGEWVRSFVERYEAFGFEGNVDPCLAFGNQYLQDLYRLFVIKLADDEEGNPFKAVPEMLCADSPLLMVRFCRTDYLLMLDEAYGQHLFGHVIRLTKNMTSQVSFFYDTLLLEGVCYAAMGDNASAVNKFEQLEEDEVLSDEVQSVIAGCYTAIGNHDKAVAIYERLAEKGSEVLDGYSYALALEQVGRIEDALDVINEEDYRNPGQEHVCRLLAWCQLNSGESDQALRNYRKLLSIASKDAKDYMCAGHAALATGDMAQAVKYYKESARLSAEGSAVPHKFAMSDEDMIILQNNKVPQVYVNLAVEAVRAYGG